MKVVILAGGSGTRLWPLSRASTPKQVQPFLDDHTLLQHTWKRMREGFLKKDIYISTTAAQVKEIKRQLPELSYKQIIAEPEARNTAAAIGLVARVMGQQFPKEIIATVNSDHHIEKSKEFIARLKVAAQAVKSEPTAVALIGIQPDYPETGYGYIERGQRGAVAGVFAVRRFVEKPSLTKAKRLIGEGRYLWNSGMFVFYPELLLSLYESHASDIAVALKALPLRLSKLGWTTASNIWSRVPKDSIDYAVIERARKLVVVKAEIGWHDVGHWRTIYDILSGNKKINIARGKVVSINSQGNLIYGSGQMVAAVGVKDLIIVSAGNAVLVCNQADAQKVKQVVEILKEKKLFQYV